MRRKKAKVCIKNYKLILDLRFINKKALTKATIYLLILAFFVFYQFYFSKYTTIIFAATPLPNPSTGQNVTDSPDPIELGQTITFTCHNCSDPDGHSYNFLVCKDSACTNCNYGTVTNCWANKTASNSVPADINATYVTATKGTYSYWARLCDFLGNCTGIAADTFSFTVYKGPEFISLSPSNLSQTLDTTPDLTFTAKSFVDLTFSCTLWIDSIAYGTNSSVLNNTQTTITANSTLALGDHNWYVNCTDSSGTTQSEIRIIGIGSDFGRCAVLIDDYGSYKLNGDILNSTISYCIDIPKNHIILDCQGHTIDGDNATNYGIFVYRSAPATTNITIKNCIVTDWYEKGIGLINSNSNTLTNITANSNYYGITLGTSNSNTLTNITANSNSRGLYFSGSHSNILTNVTANSNSFYGLILTSSNSNTLTNITANSNYYGIYLHYSNSNTVKNSRFQGNTQYGIYLYSAGNPANLIYNNLFNQTTNFYFGEVIFANNWNTTKQTGTRIYSPGIEIGGNYWTNSTGNGYSDTCTDADKDGFCDSAYTLATNNIDYLPLSDEYVACKLNGETCLEGSECCSGYCKADYDGIGKWCCNQAECAHDGTCYASGTISGNYYCDNGIWKIGTLYGENITGKNVGCYEVPYLIQNPDGSVRTVKVKVCIWK